MTTGAKIAEERKRLGMTQEQLAEVLGVTRQSVSRWESDSAYPETDKLVKLAQLFEVECDYLLKEEGKKGDRKHPETLVTRLLKEAKGKWVKLTLYEEEYDLLSQECRILDFDGMWANVECSKGKKTEVSLLPVSAIAAITFVKGRE